MTAIRRTMELRDVMRVRRLAVLLLVLAFAGCGVWPPDRPTASPSPLPADRLAFLVQGGVGGFMPYFHQALITPSLAVYGDGRVIQYDGKQSPSVPAAYLISHVDAASVAAFVADAEKRNLISESTDFGNPGVTDMPSTTVLLHGAGGLHQVSVYAFGEGFDNGLNGAQRRARKDLAGVIDRASALPGNGPRPPYSPDRVGVTELALDGAGNARGPEWPGPNPNSFLVPVAPRSVRLACGQLSGSVAEKVYGAARHNPGGIWTYAAKRRAFAVVPLLPSLEACPT